MNQKTASRIGSSNPAQTGTKRKRWLRRLLVAAAILLLVIILLPVVLRLYLSDDRIRSMAEQKLSEALGRKVTVGDFRLALLSSIEIKDLQVEDKAEYGGNMMTLENLSVAYKAFSVFGDTIEIPEIHVGGLDLHVVKTADGRMNVADLPPSPPSPPEKPKPAKPSEPLSIPNFRIGKITVESVGLAYEDKAADRTLSLQGFGLDATGSAKDNILNLDLSGRLEKIVSQTASAPPKTAPPIQADLALKLDAGRNAFEITRAELTGEGVKASLAGKGSFAPEQIGMDLQGNVFVDFSGTTLTALSGLEGQSGILNVELASSGVLPELTLKLKIEGKDLAWPVDTGDEAPAFFRMASLTAEEELSGGENQVVSLEGKAALRDMGITGKGQRIDAVDLLYTAEADLENRSGRLNRLEMKGPGLDVQASGTVGPAREGGRPIELNAALSLDLARAVEPLVPSLKGCQGVLSLNAQAHGSSLAPVMDLSLTAPSIQMTQAESGTTYRLQGLEATEKSSLAEDQIHVPVEGSFRIGRLEMVSSAGDARGFDNLSMTHSLVLDSSRYDVDLKSFETSLPGLSASASGWIKDGLSEDPQLDITKQVTMDFGEILVWAVPQQQRLLEGVLEIDAHATGSKKKPRLVAQARSDRIACNLQDSGVPVTLETLVQADFEVGFRTDEVIALTFMMNQQPGLLGPEAGRTGRPKLQAAAEATFAVPNSLLDVETFMVRTTDPGLYLEARGSVQLAGQAPSVAWFTGGNLDLGALAPLLRTIMVLSQEECDAKGTAEFTVELDGNPQNLTAKAFAKADRLELKYSPKEEAETEEEPGPEPPEKGPVPPAVDLTGKNALIKASVTSLVLNGLPIRNAYLEAKNQGNNVEIQTLRGEVGGGTLNLSAKANTGVPGWDFRIDGKAQHVGLSSLVSLYDASQADNVRGMASMNLELSGRGVDLDSLSRHLRGGGEVSMATVELSPRHWLVGALQVTGLAEFNRPVQFDAFETRLTVQDGAVMTEGLALNAGNYGARFIGGVGLDRTFRNASLDLRLPPDMISRLNIPGLDAGKLNLPEDEHFDLRIDLSGSLDDPKKKADWGSLTAQLTRTGITDLIQEKIGEEGGKQVKDLLDGLLRKKQ